MIKQYFPLALAALLSLHYASGQQILAGRVLAARDSTPIAGATIAINDSSRKTVTDRDGSFTVTAFIGGTISISSIGFKSQELPVTASDGKGMTIFLEDELHQLQEVQISTGYEQLSPERTTGSFSHIDNKLFNRQAGTDLLSRLENTVPGLAFIKGQRTANERLGINIRGQSTLFSNADPLVVLDNFPFDGDLATINPNDVLTITVLKDAAAASIWGARAGNGVIVITTKKGELEQTRRISFSSNIGLSSKPDQYYNSRMGSADYIAIEQELFKSGYYNSTELNANRPAVTPVVELLIAKRDGHIATSDVERELMLLQNIDIRREIDRYLYRVPIRQQYALALSGGSANTAYQLSLGHDRNTETLVGNDYRRNTLKLNLLQNFLNKKISWSSNVWLTQSNHRTDNPSEGQLLGMLSGNTRTYPYLRLADELGRPLAMVRDYRPSVLEMAEIDGLLDWTYYPLRELHLTNNNGEAWDMLLNTQLTYEPFPGFNASVYYQHGRVIGNSRDHRPVESYFARNQINRLTQVNADGSLTRPVPLGGILDEANTNTMGNQLRGQLNYETAIGDRYTVRALAGAEIQDSRTTGMAYRLYGYDENHASSNVVDYTGRYVSYVNPASTSNMIQNNDRLTDVTDRYVGYFANASFEYKNQYIVSGSARMDKSNIFGVKTNQKGVPLWSAGAAWNAHNAPFLTNLPFALLKIRATLGYNGNVNKQLSAYTTAFYTAANYYTQLPYARIVNPPNPELRWERIRMVNAAVDFALFGNRFSGTIEYFRKKGLDLIGRTPFAPSTGIISFTGNIANTQTNGFDVLLHSVNTNRALRWETDLSWSLVNEEVTSYAVKGTVANYLNSDNLTLGAFPLEGRPLYGIYSYHWAGLDGQTGDPIGFLDGQPSTNYAQIISSASIDNIAYHGPARPPSYGFLRNAFNYRGWSLNFTLSYRYGYYFRNSSISYGSDRGLTSAHGDYDRRWQQPGDERATYVPSAPTVANLNRDNFYLRSAVLVEKADHIRLQDVNVSYSVGGVSHSGPSMFRNLTVYANCSNLGILWKRSRSAIDPDSRIGLPPVFTVNTGLKIDF